MGPDEFASRDELALVARFLLAKIMEQAWYASLLTEKLVDSGVISRVQLSALMDEIKSSDQARRAQQARADVDEYRAIHKIAKQYLDPDQESP